MEDRASVFHFKQFAIKQRKNVFKVNTDGCLLGAFTCQFLSNNKRLTNPENIFLDIGTGTGVIACMLAQSSHGFVEGIDINMHAVKLAQENFRKSRWHERLKCHHVDITQFESPKNYQCITCNPPYFTKSLQSPNNFKNLAKHNQGLSPQTLIKKVDELLDEHGIFFTIYPLREAEILVLRATKNNLYLQKSVQVLSEHNKKVFRELMVFGREKTNYPKKSNLIIQHSSGVYTNDFKDLLKNFYLNL